MYSVFSMGSDVDMIRKNGRYVLNIDDFAKICKYFGLNPNSTGVQTFPEMIYTEYRFYDIFNGADLVSFYDHDGKFRAKKDSVDFYEDDVSNALGKNGGKPSDAMIKAIAKNVHKRFDRAKQKLTEHHEKVTEK